MGAGGRRVGGGGVPILQNPHSKFTRIRSEVYFYLGSGYLGFDVRQIAAQGEPNPR